ncbi:hypothetical protein L202_08392 [Cryptococcus amylolentus CBS 6039]|uniref:Uncharacterized protein n=2 Tax=Cryptococcus amylolentus TaxID=104669 RepID=A0A1E3HB46_9TREE|nr:hypothetical protein L202_08392 [Cryptococcus amylolentus CBS 6039]ODN72996.1 hypothetical protein L202_08392 [Cryptococcus amylolentus CBS 6039]ODN98153.1 hypothetical protein I350_07796 [Cryptococcus amylolentus CBS 6273]
MSDGKREEEEDWPIPGNVSLGYGPSTYGAPTEDTTPAPSESVDEPDTAPLDPSANTGGGAESREGSTQFIMSPTHWEEMRKACHTFIKEVEGQPENEVDPTDETTKALAALNYTTPSNLNPTISEQSIVAAAYYDTWNPPFRSFERNRKPEFDYVTARTIFFCREEPNEVVWLAAYGGSVARLRSRRDFA